MMHDTSTLNDLRRAYLFADMEPAALARVAATMHAVRLRHGEPLFSQGQPANRFFFVCEGQIKLFRLSPDGAEKIIEIIESGQTFAEAVMFMGTRGRYPVNAQAILDARLWAFDQEPFLNLLEESSEASFALLASLSRRLHMLVNQIDSLTLQNATYRLVMYLLEHVPRDVLQSPEVELITPKSAIASRLAIQPETFSRILARLRQDGLIEVQGNHIRMRDLQGLRDLVHLPPPGAEL